MDDAEINSNWRSAECVASLFDRVRELQTQNAELEAEVMHLQKIQKENSPSCNLGSSYDNVNAKLIRERDEWRDRYLQQEDLVRRLQKKLVALGDEHALQLSKYRERFVFDPNEQKRCKRNLMQS